MPFTPYIRGFSTPLAVIREGTTITIMQRRKTDSERAAGLPEVSELVMNSSLGKNLCLLSLGRYLYWDIFAVTYFNKH